MLSLKQIFLLTTLLQWTNNAMTIDSTVAKCNDDTGCMETNINIETESTTMVNIDNIIKSMDVLYSVIRTPVVCHSDEQLDNKGKCRKVF